jgi:hypothetical protein
MAGAFYNSNATAVPPPSGYYYNAQGHCKALPFGTCNNSPFGSICVYNDGSGYSEVYEHKVPVPGQGVICDAVMRHSLNDGMLN